MDEVLLCDSAICRLCGEENTNGQSLYADNNNHVLSSLVNRYLPLKVKDDGKLPRNICPGCTIQLEATVQFFDLLVEGQQKIRELWKQQVEYQKKLDRDRLRVKRGVADLSAEVVKLSNHGLTLEDDELSQQIIIKILPDGSMYAAEHDMSLQMEGLEKPRRKRGRPPKVQADEETRLDEEPQDTASQEEDDKHEEEEEELDGDGRRRRKRKVPKRFSEAVQGKELERIFKEEGVIDDEEDEDPDDDYDDTEERATEPIPDQNEEVIGHLETEEGKDLGELIVVNRGRGRGRPKIRRKKMKFTCNLCGRGFLQRGKYIFHKSLHKTVKYECLECNRKFTRVEKFNLHQKATGHTGELVISNIEDDANIAVESLEKVEVEDQPDDEVQIITEPELKLEKIEPEATPEVTLETEAEIKAVDSDVHQCDQCGKTFTTAATREIHMKEKHENTKFFTCTICDRPFAYIANLKSHMLTHESIKTEKGYACDICGKILNHPSSVVYHKEAEHNDGRRFVCNKCSKSFKHKQLLQRHQLVHSEDRPFVCKSCPASFKTKANLINHQSTHTGERKFSCEQCKRAFAHKTSLMLHYRSHSGEKPYACDQCPKSFSQKGNLQEHRRIHTGEKPYTCETCERSFTTSSQYKLHVKRHTGERPWKCQHCPNSFLHKDTWKCHMRRHLDDRPFKCEHCTKSFTEQWALKKHLRIHTGEKPYSCDVCKKAFADCSNLTKHKKIHRSKQQDADELSGTIGDRGKLWTILPEGQDGENSLANPIHQIIATEEDGGPQIILVSYQDPDNPNQSRTLHFGMLDDKEGTSSGQSLPSLDAEDTEMMKSTEQEGEQSVEQIGMDFSDPNLQLQITVGDGNAIPLSLSDARQLLSQGEFISQLNDGQTIRVHSGVVSEELADQLGINIHGNMDMNNINDMEGDETVTLIDDSDIVETDSMVTALEDDETEEEVLETTVEIPAGETIDLDEGEQTVEFITPDGQKVRLVRTYNGDPLHLNSEYLTIV